MTKPTTISQYITAAPKEAQPHLRTLFDALKAVAPDATQSLKWSMPALSHKRILVCFAAFKKHVGFYPTPSALIAFKTELKKYKTAKGSIQFPFDTPIPVALVKKIMKFRVKELKEQDGKWKGK